MPRLSKEADISEEGFVQLGETIASDKETELCLREVPLNLYSKAQLEWLITLISSNKLNKLIFEQNNLGNLSLEDWKLLCEGLKASTVQSLIIDNNQLDLFSLEHWQTFQKLIENKPLRLLSLQNNNLAALNEVCAQIVADIARHQVQQADKGSCMITDNNWSHKGFSGLINQIYSSTYPQWFLAPPKTDKSLIEQEQSLHPSTADMT